MHCVEGRKLVLCVLYPWPCDLAYSDPTADTEAISECLPFIPQFMSLPSARRVSVRASGEFISENVTGLVLHGHEERPGFRGSRLHDGAELLNYNTSATQQQMGHHGTRENPVWCSALVQHAKTLLGENRAEGHANLF